MEERKRTHYKESINKLGVSESEEKAKERKKGKKM